MKRKVVSLVMAAAMAATLFTGCGGNSGNAGGSTAGSTAGSETSAAGSEAGTADSGDVKELSFLDVSPSDSRTSYFESLFAKYEEETGIHVEYQSVPWDDAANKIMALGNAGQMPDVITCWSGWLGQLSQAGWVEPLDDYITGTEDEYTDAVVNIIWKSEQTRYGHYYTVPDGLMVKGVYVRKDWCDEAGIKLDPKAGWTYDEYFDTVAKLTDKEKGRYGVSYRGARGALDPLLVYLQSFTGGATYDAEGKILINSDECLQAFTKWTDLYKNGYAPEDSINWGFTEMVDNFKGGLTGTLINDSEVAPSLIDGMEDGTWMVMPMPKSTKDGVIYNTMNAPYAYAVSDQQGHKDAAWKLIQYMTASENQAEYCQMTGEIPIKKDAAEMDLYSEDGVYGAFLQQMNDPNVAVPATFGPFDYTELHQGLFHEEIQSYLLGDEDAKTALDNICNALQERMDEYMAENPDTQVETALRMN